MLNTFSELGTRRRSQQIVRRRRGVNDLLIHTSTSIPLSAMEEIEMMASERNVKLAPLLRSLILRGLESYHRDGLLEEPN